MTDPVQQFPQPQSEPFALRYELTHSDIADLGFSVCTDPFYPHTLIRQRRARCRASLVVAGALYALSAVAYFCPLYMGSINIAIPVAAAFLVVAAATSVIAVRFFRLTTDAYLRFEAFTNSFTESAQYHRGHHSIGVGPLGIAHSCRHHDVMVRWSGIGTIQIAGEWVIIHRRDRELYAIPFRAFSSREEVNVFVDAFYAWHRAASAATGESAFHRIANYLAEHDVPCPACKHSLRGTRTGYCPRCDRCILESDMPYYADMPQ